MGHRLQSKRCVPAIDRTTPGELRVLPGVEAETRSEGSFYRKRLKRRQTCNRLARARARAGPSSIWRVNPDPQGRPGKAVTGLHCRPRRMHTSTHERLLEIIWLCEEREKRQSPVIFTHSCCDILPFETTRYSTGLMPLCQRKAGPKIDERLNLEAFGVRRQRVEDNLLDLQYEATSLVSRLPPLR